MTEDDTTDTANGDASSADASGEASTDDHGLEWYLHRSAIVTLFVAGLFVAVAFYGSVDRAIEVWIGDRFVDLFKAVFNLAVLLVIGYGLAHEIRTIRSRED